MDTKVDIGNTATCTTCTFSEDFSNYWTAVLYFKAQNVRGSSGELLVSF